MALFLYVQSDFKYGSVPPGREIRSDLWSVEYFVARGWQPTPNLTAFDIFSKAVKQLSHKYAASVSELTHGSFVSLLMSCSKLEMAECVQRRRSCTPNREGRYFNSTPVQLTYLVSGLSGSKLQTSVWQNQKSCVSRLRMNTVTHVVDMRLICCRHYRSWTNCNTSNSETWFSLNLYAQPGNTAAGGSWCNCTVHKKTGRLDDASLQC